ncbi:MAG: TM2 domain-containing protein [Firmicutes bacterium]|nr:TM2 domain-containing protein [Bacillota bacterium]
MAAKAEICPKCGCRVEAPAAAAAAPQIVINNSNQNSNQNINQISAMMKVKQRNKLVAFFLCLFLGFLGAHKFYEGKTGMGVLYLFTGGLFGIGVIIDLITILFKPNPYFV